MFNKVITNTQESSLPLVDRLPFFDINIDTVSKIEEVNGLAKILINNSITVFMPIGMVGVLIKRFLYRLYYQLLDDKSIEIIIVVRK